MIKTYCDKCMQHILGTVEHINVPGHYNNGYKFPAFTYDLCHPCFDTILKFIEPS